MDVFNRKIDLNLCADNLMKEIDFLTNKENSFEEFKEMIKRNASIGKIESDHIRPFIWKIMLDEKNWKNKKTLEEIIQDFQSYNKQYNNKLKSSTHKKKFKKDPLGNSSDVSDF